MSSVVAYCKKHSFTLVNDFRGRKRPRDQLWQIREDWCNLLDQVYALNKEILDILESDKKHFISPSVDTIVKEWADDDTRLKMAYKAYFVKHKIYDTLVMSVQKQSPVFRCCRWERSKWRWSIGLSMKGNFFKSKTITIPIGDDKRLHMSFPDNESICRIPEQGLSKCLPVIKEIRDCIADGKVDDELVEWEKNTLTDTQREVMG